MIIEVIGITVPPEIREDFTRDLASFLGPTQVEPGCLSCILYQDWSDSSIVYIESRWDTKDNMIHHIRSDSYKKLIHLMELGTKPPIVEFHTVCESRGLDFIEAVRGH